MHNQYPIFCVKQAVRKPYNHVSPPAQAAHG